MLSRKACFGASSIFIMKSTVTKTGEGEIVTKKRMKKTVQRSVGGCMFFDSFNVDQS